MRRLFAALFRPTLPASARASLYQAGIHNPVLRREPFLLR